jgi:hypothetical protein
VPHDVSETADRIVFVMSGVIDDTEFTESAEEVREIVTENRELDEVVDLTAVEQFAVTPATLRSVSANPPLFSPRSVQIFVAPDRTTFWLLRMYQILTETKRPNLMVVRTMDQAEDLLKIKWRSKM